MHERNKPLIGVVPLVDDARESYWMLPGYMKGIEAAGGLPVMLPLTDDPADIAQMARLCDGVLLTGGQDVEPAVYGQEKLDVCGACCASRDRMEIRLIEAMLEADKPILGICRGLQLLNACLGGTLYQDLPTQHPSSVCHSQKPPYDVPVHRVTLAKGTPLAQLLGKESIRVNSYHHQAIRALSERLEAMAIAEDGIIEAVRCKDKRFVWAVQWHPEFFGTKHEDSMKLLSAFVACAGA